jgi:3-oxoacyl-[acyl-carrier-protein] synthase-3
MTPSLSLRAVGVHLPAATRTNQWYQQHHPDAVARQHHASLARLWSVDDGASLNAWDRAMVPHLGDPFRGAVERRVIGPGEGSLSLAAGACRAALAAAGLAPTDVDYALVAALRPDCFVVGEAAQLAQRVGLSCPAVFYESACNAPIVGLQLARGLVAGGIARRVLIVCTSTYTRDTDPADSFSWFLGDGSGAMIVEAQGPGSTGAELLGLHTVPTQETCGVFQDRPHAGGAQMTNIDRQGGRKIRDHAERWLRSTVEAALDAAGVNLDDVAALVVNTPVAWYADFVAGALRIDRERVFDTHHRYANAGPALLPLNLHAAVSAGRLRPGDRVVVHSVGSESTAGAAVFRWGDVAVGGGG